MDAVAAKPVGKRDLAKRIIARYGKLKSNRDSFFMPAWQSSAEWICPRKSSILGHSEKSPGDAGWVDQLFDCTAMKASERLAAWLMTNTSPANARWFAFSMGPNTRRRLGSNSGPAAQWYQHVTEVTLEQLQGSNFYTEKHEGLNDRNNFGTCSVGAFKGKRAALNFRGLDVGTYVIGADEEGFIDTVIREFKLTARQAAQMFGKESLGPKVTEALNSETKQDEEFTFYHSVSPNTERDPGYDDAINKPVKSCYVCKDDEIVVQESGYDDMPYAVSRFLKWTGDTWGWAPAFTALPTVRETNFFKMQMNALAELAAFPPMGEPDNMAGQLDLRAGGRNVYDSTMPDALPKPLYQVKGDQLSPGMLLLEQNREFINQAFFGDVIAMFSNLERDITAFEASQLMGEKLDVFAPYYFRLINELDTPLLNRCFSLLLEQGMYDEPPAELLVHNGDGTATIDLPEVVYLSRLALAVQAHEIQSLDAFIARGQQLATIDPSLGVEWFKAIDLVKASRRTSKNLGMPVDIQRTDEELEEMAAAEAEAAAAAQAAEQAPAMASAAKDIDGMSPNTKNRLAEAMAQN